MVGPQARSPLSLPSRPGRGERRPWCGEDLRNQVGLQGLATHQGAHLADIRIERSNGVKRLGIGLLDKHHSNSTSSGTVGTVGTVSQKSPIEKPPKGTFPPECSNCSNPSNLGDAAPPVDCGNPAPRADWLASIVIHRLIHRAVKRRRRQGARQGATPR